MELEALIAGLEGFGPVIALRRSPILYPLVNAAHILGIALLLGNILVLDWRLVTGGPGALAGIRPRIRAAALGLALAVPTGLALATVNLGAYLDNPAFRLKLLLLLAMPAVIVAQHHLLARRSAAKAAPGPGIRALAAGSALLWLAILLAGRWIAFAA